MSAKEQYNHALKQRHLGIPSSLGPEADFLDVKPEFYADSRLLSEDALEVFTTLRTSHPPYGLIDHEGKAVTSFEHHSGALRALSIALRTTAHAAFDRAEPTVQACPYHEVLDQKLGTTQPALKPYDHNEHGLDTLRAVTVPGGELNAPVFVSLVNRMPALQQLHGSQTDPEGFARRSVSLLREPLNHPQQWAVAFVYSMGRLPDLLGPNYLRDELALEYTKLDTNAAGQERLAWAMPVADFRLQDAIRVLDRTRGSETDQSGEHRTLYPAGTRLRDIEVTEPTLGCPGNLMANELWQTTVNVFVGENLWVEPV